MTGVTYAGGIRTVHGVRVVTLAARTPSGDWCYAHGHVYPARNPDRELRDVLDRLLARLERQLAAAGVT